MNYPEPQNANYAARVVSIKSIVELENCDNVVGTPLFGFQAIVSKGTQVGELGIVFPAESQLSPEYAFNNNLFRHGNLNKDPAASGYLEDNARVKAMKFRGHRSDCLFMPLTSLEYTGVFWGDLQEGDVFDELNGHKICNKYEAKKTSNEHQIFKNKQKKFERVDQKHFPLHYDSANFFYNQDVIPDDKIVYVTQKLHGTSVRVANTIVARQPSILERIAKRLGVKVADHDVDYVFGSRRVTKDANNQDQAHYYEDDIWTLEGKRLEGIIPENFVVFGELIGWTPTGGAIQKNYTYQVPAGTADLYVYRVAHVNREGLVTDLSWDQVIEFCNDRNLKHVPELWRGQMKDLRNVVAEEFLDIKFMEHTPSAVPLDPASPCDEGVCIRLDGLAPYILKAKSPMFYAYETAMLDEEAVDMEEQQ